MNCFPNKKFWKHVFIVRTHAEKGGRSFFQTKTKLEGSIVKSINDKDFKNFNNFMINKNIELTQKIDEFFVINLKDATDNYKYNEEEFNKIFNKIKNTRPMFKNIIKNDKIDQNGLMFQTFRQIKLINYEGNEINFNSYLSSEFFDIIEALKSNPE